MINSVTLDGFNGFDCSHELGQHTLITGNVGSGKTSIWQAIQFVLSPVASANMANVFEEHYAQSSGTNMFSASLEIDGKTITRELRKTEKGIAQSFLHGDRKLSTKEESILLKELNVSIPTIEAFIEMSDAKKIADICEKFGEGEEIATLGDRIERLRGEVTVQQQTILNQRGMIERLDATAKTKAAYSPEGLLVIEDEIKKVEAQIKEAEEEEAATRRAAAEKIREEQAKKAIDDRDLEIARLKVIEAENMSKPMSIPVSVEEIQELCDNEIEHLRITFQPVHVEQENVLPTFVQNCLQESQSLPCKNCLNTLNNVIAGLEVSTNCYACGAEQMVSPATINLKVMRNKVQSLGGGQCKN